MSYLLYSSVVLQLLPPSLTRLRARLRALVLNGLLEARDMMAFGLAPLSACASANVQANLRIVLLIFYYTNLLYLTYLFLSQDG